MQMARRSFSPFFSSARMSFLFHPGIDMCANSALALKGRGGGGLCRRMTLHPAEQPEYQESESLGEKVLWASVCSQWFDDFSACIFLYFCPFAFVSVRLTSTIHLLLIDDRFKSLYLLSHQVSNYFNRSDEKPDLSVSAPHNTSTAILISGLTV